MEILRAKAIPGYFPGMPQPSLMLDLSYQSNYGVSDLAQFAHEVGIKKGDIERLALTLQIQVPSIILHFMAGVSNQLQLAGFPVYSAGIVLHKNSTPGQIRIFLPSNWHGPHATITAAKVNLERLTRLKSNTMNLSPIQAERELKYLKRHQAPKGMNSLRFLNAAYELEIPVQHIANNVYQFGWGKFMRWLDSSFTDCTTAISTTLSRDKVACAKVLDASGIPVPQHAIAKSEDDAVLIAHKLGFPVVVKPSNLDGGIGVSAGLHVEQEVRKAYQKALALSTSILIEKHFEGNDYRIHVFNNEVYWVAHRQPAGVTGDGASNISQLINNVNSDHRRGPKGSNALLKLIDIDNEALDLLAQQSLAIQDIPQKGHFVRLRRAANIANGGIPIPIALDLVHPDNLMLAACAARALRLDLAGVDMLIPDIKRSWQESGAVICEVNAQPQLSPSLHSYLMKRIVCGQGRIPIIVVLGELSQAIWLETFQKAIRVSGRCLALVTPDKASVGMEFVTHSNENIFKSAITLLRDSRAEIFMLLSNNLTLADSGFPVDRIDSLVLLDPPKNIKIDSQWELFCQIAIQMCVGQIWVSPTLFEDLSKHADSSDPRLNRIVPEFISEELMKAIQI